MTTEAKREKNRIANKKWRENHPDKAKENNRLKWIKHGHKYLQKYIDMNQTRKEYFQSYYLKKKKVITIETNNIEVNSFTELKTEPFEKPKKINLFYILDVLRKAPKSQLYSKPIAKWTMIDWRSFNELEKIT